MPEYIAYKNGEKIEVKRFRGQNKSIKGLKVQARSKAKALNQAVNLFRIGEDDEVTTTGSSAKTETKDL